EPHRRNRALDSAHAFPSSTVAPELWRSPRGEAAPETRRRVARISAELEQVTAGAADPIVVGGVERLLTGFLRQHPQAQQGDVVEMHDVWLGLRDEFLVGPVHALRLPRQEGGQRLQAAVPAADRVKMDRFVRRAIRWGRLPLGFQTKRGRRKLDVDFMPALDEGTGEV